MRSLMPIVSLLIVSCIDPITLKVGTKDNLLTIDAVITNQDGPQYVVLGRSQTFDNTLVPPANLVPESGATVVIFDDEQPNMLMEISSGKYVSSSNLKGIVGHSYRLDITTTSGQHYVSQNEVLPQGVLIESLPYTYTVYERFIENASGTFVSTKGYGFNVSVTVNDPPAQHNYYRWKVSGIFEFFSLSDNPDITHCYAPTFRLENKVLVKDDNHDNGSAFTVPLAIVPYDRPTYYLATVHQQSITEKAFEFWNNVSKQQLNTGSIFDPIPAPIQGNVYNVDDTHEEVLGYFYATSVTEKSVLISRFHDAGFVSPSPNMLPVPGDCLTQIAYATRTKPPGFP